MISEFWVAGVHCVYPKWSKDLDVRIVTLTLKQWSCLFCVFIFCEIEGILCLMYLSRYFLFLVSFTRRCRVCLWSIDIIFILNLWTLHKEHPYIMIPESCHKPLDLCMFITLSPVWKERWTSQIFVILLKYPNRRHIFALLIYIQCIKVVSEV